jgi:pyridoxamine 5'-phosphate oxidase
MSENPSQILLEETVGHDPFAFFERWYAEAQQAGMIEPAAMALATATPAGEPSLRIVLLRSFDRQGFVFFTNYLSRKGSELAANPRAALAFYWAELERQVRIEGQVSKVTAAESDAYFLSRPVGHRIGALASPQSQVIADRDTLERRTAELTEQYSHHQVPRPSHWGGYRVTPHTIEFWQGRANRLHDRLRFRQVSDGSWLRERLAP